MSIRSELLSFEFYPEIVDEAEKIYKQINNSVSRGKKRNLKTLYCVFNAHLNLDRVTDIKLLAQKMNIPRKKISKAFTLCSPIKTGYIFRKVRFSISDYIGLYTDELGLEYTQKAQINYLSKNMFNDDKDKVFLLKENSNQTLAIAFIIHYLKSNGYDKDIERLKRIVYRPTGTVDSVVKKISEIENNK